MEFFTSLQNEIIYFLNNYQFNEESIKFLSYIIGISFIIVLFLGISNTVIVYKNNNDFLWSMAVIIIPMMSLFGLILLQPDKIPNDYNFFYYNIHNQAISISGCLLTFIALLKMMFNTISNNGFLGGLFMFIFKLLAGFIIVIFILGFLSSLFKKGRSVRSLLVAMVAFGAFSFILKKLINGSRVKLKKTIP